MDSREEALDRLLEMGYLKYVEPSRREEARLQLRESLLKFGYLDTDAQDDYVTLDRRNYPGDAENLAEGGIGESLLLMKDVLARERVQSSRMTSKSKGTTCRSTVKPTRSTRRPTSIA